MLKLCQLSDLTIAKGRLLKAGECHLILVRTATSTVRLYLNRCPHLGIPLAWQDSQLMSPDGSAFQCGSHGALFVPETGYCTSGPCEGDQLWSFTCQIENGAVFMDETELPDPVSLN